MPEKDISNEENIYANLQKLPGFSIEYPNKFVEFPKTNNLTEIDFKYPLIIPFANAHIKWNSDIEQLIYYVEEPQMTNEEKKMLKKIVDELVDAIQVGFNSIKDQKKAQEYLESQVIKIIESLNLPITKEQFVKIMYFIYRDFIGLNKIEPLLRDPWIEDIGCDGVNVPIYVVHRKYGSIQTNIKFDDINELREFVIKLAEKSGRYISYAEPILDGTLPDGSRINASLAGDVTTRGPTFSIRKFSERPYSPVELIEFNTASSDIMAFFWYLVENGASILIAGGVATGKTTLLNSICMFIPPEAKVVSIEDTRELKIPHEHWIPAVTRLGFGVPMPTGEKYGEITLFDLLKSSFRQNPDYVIVGEVRGKEAYVLFQGISSGHPSLTTFHAGSIDTVIKRLTTPPIELSASLVESLDVVVIMSHAKEKGKSARRVKEVEEIKSIEPDTLKVVANRVAEWDPSQDNFNFYGNSLTIEKISRFKGISVEDAWKEIARRKSILEWMLRNGIKDYEKVSVLINEYYKNPEKVLSRIDHNAELKIDKPKTVEIEVKEQKPIKVVVEQVVKPEVQPINIQPVVQALPAIKNSNIEITEEYPQEKQKIQPIQVPIPISVQPATSELKEYDIDQKIKEIKQKIERISSEELPKQKENKRKKLEKILGYKIIIEK
ncbi:MAG: type II/IV secretion system ATPase subunit [Candidatus Aenigmarchaeota archaeon]|nr:type II/IV secretion system ATPase subunit [Candidatus Aenigmarchaeota archaeon]MBU5688848.1 type II/IV secretion system ATPase subunit [Candidatus Aenigmarchaeota archaeon]